MQASTHKAVNSDFATSILHIAFVVHTSAVDIGCTTDGDGAGIGQGCRCCAVPEAHVIRSVNLDFGTSVVAKRGFIDNTVLTGADVRTDQYHTVVRHRAEVVHTAGRRAGGPFEGEATGGRDGECCIGFNCDGFGHCRRADDWVVDPVWDDCVIRRSGYRAVVPIGRFVPVGVGAARPDVASSSGQDTRVVGDAECAAVKVLYDAAVVGDVARAAGVFDDDPGVAEISA